MTIKRRPVAPDPYLPALAKAGARIRYAFATHSGRIDIDHVPRAAVWQALNIAEVLYFFQRIDPAVHTIRVGDVLFHRNAQGGWDNFDKRRGQGLPWTTTRE